MHICSNASVSIIKQKAQLSTGLFQYAAHVLQKRNEWFEFKKVWIAEIANIPDVLFRFR